MILATYNLHLCQEPKVLISTIKKLVKNNLIDIFCFQEVVRNPEGEAFTEILIKKLGTNWKVTSNIGNEKSWYSIGNAIVWNSNKLTLKRSKNFVLPPNKKFTLKEIIFSQLIAGGAYKFQRRSLVAEYIKDSLTIQIANIHLDNNGGQTHRKKQLKYVLTQLNPKVNFSVVCGDFNTFDLKKTGHEIAEIHQILGDDYKDASSNSGWTADLHRVNFQKANPIFSYLIKRFEIHIRKKLDYVWVKGGQKNAFKKLDVSGSDHLPLVVSLQETH